MAISGNPQNLESSSDSDHTMPLFPESDSHGLNGSDWPDSRDASPWEIIGGSPEVFLSKEALDGGWYVQLQPEDDDPNKHLCGPLRIEQASGDAAESFGDFLISADLYRYNGDAEAFPEPITQNRLDIYRNWYPQLPWARYFSHIKCKQGNSVSYDSGNLSFDADHYLWDENWYPYVSAPQESHFDISCPQQIVKHGKLPQPTLRLTGKARLGTDHYRLIATKTSPLYRGCRLEVDVMRDRYWISGAYRHSGAWESFTGVFRKTGFDIRLSVSKTDIPSAVELSKAQLNERLHKYREFKLDKRSWRLWMLVASRLDEIPGDTEEPWFGIMFDSMALDDSWREGVAIFYDPPVLHEPEDKPVAPDLKDKRLGDLDVAFLRTALHEAGHAFGLIHPVDDHRLGKRKGRTIMNRTGDVKSNATEEEAFPYNIEFAFDPQNALFLIHSPDPKVAPGWSRGFYSDATWPEFIIP